MTENQIMSTSSAERPADLLDRLPLRERKKLKTRRAIQDHALRLFTAQGYDETTVEQIAAAAEVSPSTFFRYFPTKEDVVITDEYDPVMAQVFRAQPAELSPIEALRATFREVMTEMYEQDLDQIVTRTRLMLSVPALRARTFDAMREGTMGVVIEIIAERVGRAQDDPDVQAFSWAVMGVMQAAVYTWLDNQETTDLPALVDHNLELLAAGCPL